MTKFKINGLSNITIGSIEIKNVDGIALVPDDVLESDEFARFYAETKYMSGVIFDEPSEVVPDESPCTIPVPVTKKGNKK